MNRQLEHILSKLSYTIDLVSLDELVNGRGVTAISLAVAREEVEPLRHAILREKESGMVASPTVGDIYQDFYQKTDFNDRDLLEALAKKLEKEISREVYKKSGLTPLVPIDFKSRVIQHYVYNDKTFLYGIPPHYDHRAFVEIVAILLLEGDSLFYTANNKEGVNERFIDANPMDIILMRGYQFGGQEDGRPVHYVKKILKKEGRTTLSFRIYSDNEEHLTTMRKAFSKV